MERDAATEPLLHKSFADNIFNDAEEWRPPYSIKYLIRFAFDWLQQNAHFWLVRHEFQTHCLIRCNFGPVNLKDKHCLRSTYKSLPYIYHARNWFCLNRVVVVKWFTSTQALPFIQ